jgi:trimeric autotransporter adhesin
MQSCAARIGVVALVVTLIAGCGGGNTNTITPPKNTNGVVGQVTLSPASLSIVAGQVSQITPAAVNPSGGAVTPTPTFTFNSSNTAIASVSPSGEVCAGAWDALFIVCNGKDAAGNPIAGTAVITASAQGVTSAPIQVSVHPPVTSIVVDQAPGCFSIKQTFKYTPTACSTAVTPHDTTGPCAPNAKNITSQIGTFTWTETSAGVASVDANGVATANAPGVTGVIASVGSVASPFTSFRSCMPVQIRLHLNGDPAGQPTESSSIAVAATLTMQADMVDENNVTTNSAPVSIISNNTEIAQLTGTTLTGESPGGAGIVAACIPPACGAGLDMPVYSNIFNLTVTGTSPTTFVYAASSFAPPAGTTPTMIPIDTSKSPIVAGTAINLPGTPNSLVFNALGTKGYMGTSAGFAALDTTANAVALLDPFVGKVLAVSPNGNIVILSNAASAPDPVTGVVGPIQPVGPSQRLVIFNAASSTIESLVLPGAVAAAFTSDSFTAYIAVDCSHNTGPAPVTPCPSAYIFSPASSLQSITLSGAATATGAATIASGPFAYLVNGSPAALQVVSTCNNAQQLTANNPPTTSAVQLVGSTQNANIIVAVNQSGVDIETATITPVTPPIVLSPANCAPGITYSDQFIDFAQGPFTARQLMVPTNGTGGNNGSHIVVLPEGINKVLVAVPGASAAAITLPSGATEALSGGMTLDGNTAWVGVAGTNTVDEINLTNNTDALQIKTSFTKSDGTPAPPNIVGVKPH